MPDFSHVRIKRSKPPYPSESLVNIDGKLYWSDGLSRLTLIASTAPEDTIERMDRKRAANRARRRG